MPLCTHTMSKQVCKISHRNSKPLLSELQKIPGGATFLPHTVELIATHYAHQININICSAVSQCLREHKCRHTHTQTG